MRWNYATAETQKRRKLFLAFSHSNTVSVIIPSFNNDRTIQRALRSVLSQNYPYFEVIVSDDASSDSTVEKVQDMRLSDCRIKLLTAVRNEGAGVARNKAIEEATGRYIAFLDADDEWLPGKLQRQVDFFDTNVTVPLSYGAYRRVSRNGQILVVNPPRKVTANMLLYHSFIGCLTAMYDTTRTNGKVYMSTIRRRQDWALWIRITKAFGDAVGLPEVLGTLYRDAPSLTTNKWQSTKDTASMLKAEFGISGARASMNAMIHNVVALARLRMSTKETNGLSR